mgnify:FL=1
MEWKFDEAHSRPDFAFAPPSLNNGLSIEVRAIANYWRAEILLNSPKRWSHGVWAHEDTRDQAIASAEAAAGKLGWL